MHITLLFRFKPLYLQVLRVWRKVDISPHPMLYFTKPINTLQNTKK